ncbi:DUF669 domain-containing protein [Anaerococcus hydrogenalis]|uniref:DUF669 domain-containing protein n=1 Tax=Anaerococcus hydrogenalis TaxID=33029 RepID=UPI001DF27134|nr:DUF669 domain-containing protein [Anaerococcus hydrogenalis]MBS5989686.1 DUF669 domain-containing protein [Anaerococcus hydrogenalis]
MTEQAINWDKFDKSVDVEGLNKDLQENKDNHGEYKEVPLGEYEVKVNKMELTTSKKGDPMLSIWFKILDGDYKNSLVFYNQILNLGFQIHMANEMLRSFDTGIDVPSEFKGYAAFNELILDISEEIDSQGLEYALEYDENKKGYKTFKITEVFES